MSGHTEATGAAAGVIVALAAAMQGAISASLPVTVATEPIELLYGAIGGAIGGLLLIKATGERDLVDRAVGLLLSAGVGLALGPGLAHYAAVHGLSAAGDAFAALPVGCVAGAVVPPVFSLAIAALAAAKSNPTGIIDFFKKARADLVNGKK